MIHASIHEETEDKIYHFYSGLRIEIKEYNIVTHLFQLAMLAKEEL
jgi:hypothetical protein